MKSFTLAALALFAATSALGQNTMPGMAMPMPPAKPQPTTAQPLPERSEAQTPPPAPVPAAPVAGRSMPDGSALPGAGMPRMARDSSDGMMMSMRNSFSKNLPMSRQGSGTSWHPDSSPMYMQMQQRGGWDMMLMYSVFLRYTRQNFNHGDLRGDANLRANSYLMGMANHLVGQRGLFSIQAMLSADPVTVGGAGYPLLFQTGESWQGRKLHDHQHPHDLVSALAVAYTYAASDNVDLTAYVGYPGEPAIGPPVFMHRPSAANLPAAPLGHHWQDATHIQFGVATLGVRYRNAKLEGSLYTGREPNENRYSFDRPRFDSYSGRLSVNPSANLALQVSAAHLKSPEELEPADNVNRYTTSALHNVNLNADCMLSTTLVGGLNHHSGSGDSYNSNSLLLESNLQAQAFNVFTRLETLQLNYDELELPAASDAQARAARRIGAFTLGASKYVAKTAAGWLDLGLSGTLNTFDNSDATLLSAYGKNPLSFEVYLRFIAPRTSMHLGGMGHGGMKHSMKPGGMKM
ncbi:MAG: hypothetical protein M3Y54_07095 [Bacteroidota bacterium]|nr:hypothetical protein [Bacteroidota bacterium]